MRDLERTMEHALDLVQEVERALWRMPEAAQWRGVVGNERLQRAAARARSALYGLSDLLEEHFDERRARLAQTLAARYDRFAEPSELPPWANTPRWHAMATARHAASREAAARRIAIANELASSPVRRDGARRRRHGSRTVR